MNTHSQTTKIDQKLPVLISVPHGGNKIPIEVHDSVALTEKDIFDDSDALTRKIYDFKYEVAAYIDTPIARAIMDLNRAPNDRPPENPDGVFKTETITSRPIYKSGCFPNELSIQKLLSNYYFPYHKMLDVFQNSKRVILALDCHSMMSESPPISDEPGKSRPLICLSNRGDEKGLPKNERENITCPSEMIQLLAKCFRRVFSSDEGEIKINEPFSGGYIIRSHYKGTIPWIQVEINRKLYLSPPYFNADNLTVTSERIAELRNRILTVIRMFLKRI